MKKTTSRLDPNVNLTERCNVLQLMIFAIAPIYKTANENQKSLIETTIGAAIFYLPHGEKYWTGKISQKALDALIENPGARLTKEHQFPRKIAGREVLEMALNNPEELGLEKLYEEKYALYNLVTPEENHRLVRFQRGENFNTIEDAYKRAGIKLVEITPDDFKALKRSNTKKRKAVTQDEAN